MSKLKAAGKKAVSPRPNMPALKELFLNEEELIAKFTREIITQTGVVHRVQDNREALARLTEIVQSEKITGVMASNDDVVRPLDLSAWGRKNNIKVLEARHFDDRRRFVDAVFEEAQAGITGADFAVAESGTIGLIPNQDHARLISLAPIHHIAVVPLERLVPVYENVTEALFGNGQRPPRHVTFITGPSMTADIRATPFKGMHGPRKLEIILIG